jgi:hypothetical protein
MHQTARTPGGLFPAGVYHLKQMASIANAQAINVVLCFDEPQTILQMNPRSMHHVEIA